MRIGYAKLGRSIAFDEGKYGFQGDAEAPNLLYRLAARNPDVEWVIVGRNDKRAEFPYPNITNPWSTRKTGMGVGFADKLAICMGALDGLIIQVGQHGTSHTAIPQSTSTWAQFYEDPENHATTPQDWAFTYAGFLIKGINTLCDRTDGRAPVVYLVSDPRNYIFARDIKWPTGLDDILAQYQYTREQRHERFRDPRSPEALGVQHVTKVDRDGEVWVVRHTHRYADLELMILPDDWRTWGSRTFDERQDIGVASTSFNAFAPGGSNGPRRSELIRDFVLSYKPDAEIFGKWDEVSLKDVGKGQVIVNDPTEFPDLLQRWRTTVALPALGTSWTVAKPYQCWAANTVCFMVGRVDDQGWTLPSRREVPGNYQIGNTGLYSVRDNWTTDDLVLAQWLRVESPDELHSRVKTVNADFNTWAWLTTAQRTLLARRWDAHYLESEIERKLKIRE